MEIMTAEDIIATALNNVPTTRDIIAHAIQDDRFVQAFTKQMMAESPRDPLWLAWQYQVLDYARRVES